MHIKWGLCCLWVLGTYCLSYGQFSGNDFTNFKLDTAQDINIPDSTIINYFYLRNIDDKITMNDTSISRFSHGYDPSRNSEKEYFNLGNTGSAARPILYDRQLHMGTNYGYHSYDVYKLSNKGFKYYDVNRPFLDFFFTPVGGQQNFVIKSDFARSFANGIQLSVNYDRINQEGFYTSQEVKHTNFGLGVWYHHPKGKRDLFITFMNEVNTENHNGGVTDRSSLFTFLADNRKSIGTIISSAATRNQSRSYQVKHIQRLQDTLHNNTGFSIESNFSLNFGYYKFSDSSVENDATYYGQYYIDKRGLRNYTGYTQINTSHLLHGELFSNLSGNVGVDYTYHAINLEGENKKKNDLFLTGSLKVPINNNISIDAKALIGLGSTSGDFRISGATSVGISRNTTLRGNVDIYRTQHPLTAQSLYVNESVIQSGELSKPFGSLFKGSILFPFLNFNLGIEQSVENNTLFYNLVSSPQINEDVYTATQLYTSFSLRIWKINMDNFLAGQLFSNNLFHLPKYYSKHNLYLEGKIFKERMDIRLGVEGRIIGPHNRLGYNPLMSEFYQVNGSEDIYPFGDIYLSGKIQSLRFFLKLENIGTFASNAVYYEIGEYPQYDRKFRFGIRWHFLD